MAILTFNIPNNLNPRQAAYDALRSADYWGTAATANEAKKALYGIGLLTMPEVISLEEMLQVSPTKTPFGSADRNTISFRFENIVATLSGATIKLSRNNTIVSTALAGRRGTVKEFIKAEDYKITVSGILVNTSTLKPTAYPADMLRNLVRLFQAEDMVEVSSAYLSIFDINNVVLSGYTFEQDKKYVNAQPFTLELISDDETDLYKTEED